jgi:flavodoxin
MINPNNTREMAENLEDILERDVVSFELDVLPEKDRAYITSLMYRWTQGEDVKQRIETIINPRQKYSDKTKHYLKQKL